jgi:hypothetical protein
MTLCFTGLWWTRSKAAGYPSHAAAPQPPVERYTLMAAFFLLAAVMTAAAYLLLVRRDDVRERARDGLARIAARLTPTVQRIVPAKQPISARAIFYFIVGGSAVIGGLLAALLYSFGADGSPLGGVGEGVGATVAGGVQGAVIGLAFGLVLAAPTAIIVWLLGRGRR